MTISGHAAEQGRLWGTDPEGWLLHGEAHNVGLFEAALDASRVAGGTRVLDVGCGTGGALLLARDRGAVCSGLDASAPLLDLARARLPDAELVLGEADLLPWGDATFEAVIGVNSFQFAADPRTALCEAVRVVRPGGRVAATLFAEPERSEATAIHRALSELTRAAGQVPNAPYALSAPGALDAAMEAAGLESLESGEVSVVWSYPDSDAVVRGILSSAGGARALLAVDRPVAASAIVDAVRPFTREDGGVRLVNTFRWVSGVRMTPGIEGGS